MIAGCSLTSEKVCPRGDLEVRILLETVVFGDDVQNVKVLTLVLMNAFDLDIEQPVRIKLDTGLRRYIVR